MSDFANVRHEASATGDWEMASGRPPRRPNPRYAAPDICILSIMYVWTEFEFAISIV